MTNFRRCWPSCRSVFVHAASDRRESATHAPLDHGRLGGHARGHTTSCRQTAVTSHTHPPHTHPRVACAVSFAGPTDWSLLGKIEHKHPAYRQLLGYEPGTPAAEMSAKALTDVSPISCVSAHDPPIIQVHGDKDDIVPIEHARDLDKRLSSVGVVSELVVIAGANHGVAGAAPQVSEQARKFVREHLGIARRE